MKIDVENWELWCLFIVKNEVWAGLYSFILLWIDALKRQATKSNFTINDISHYTD